MTTKKQTRIPLLNLVMNYMDSRDLKNYDDFAKRFVDVTLLNFERGFDEVSLPKGSSGFLRLNRITEVSFLTPEFVSRIKALAMEEDDIPLILEDIFPEVKNITDVEAESALASLNIAEKDIQDALRNTLRSRGASPIPRRGKDSPLEVADVEHFTLKVRQKSLSIVVVVKGYNSIKGQKVSWEDIAHQITKAYDATRPDHVLLVLAKEPKDGVITQLSQFSEGVGKPGLIILVLPLGTEPDIEHRSKSLSPQDDAGQALRDQAQKITKYRYELEPSAVDREDLL